MQKYKAISHTKKRMKNRPKYILRNKTRNDVSIGDLRYKIPAGKARDLLSPTAHLSLEDIEKSALSGSISKRLGKSLFLVKSTISPVPPSYELAKPSSVVFPQRIKSSVTIEIGDITDEIQGLILDEDEEFLKKLDNDSLFDGKDEAPIIAKADEEED